MLLLATCIFRTAKKKKAKHCKNYAVVHIVSVLESRTQGSRQGQEHKKKSKAKDSPNENRPSRGQGKECSRLGPRTQAQVLAPPPNKRSSEKSFRRSPEKSVFQKLFQALHKLLTTQKLVLSASEDKALRPRTSKCVFEDSTSA